MGMICRADVFEKYDITPPTTWAEYAAAAEKVKAAGGPLFGQLCCQRIGCCNGPSDSKGCAAIHLRPFSSRGNWYLTKRPGLQRMSFSTGRDLASKGLVGTENQFTPEYIAGVVNGDYATYISAAWAPGYLTGQGVGSGESEGKFATAPIPQWDAANPVSINWGGSALSVTSQSKQVELAAKVALAYTLTDASLADGWKNQIIFPLNQKVLGNSESSTTKFHSSEGSRLTKTFMSQLQTHTRASPTARLLSSTTKH